ncbi:protein phosphatase CheZ [Kordiimonas sp. SCSIO 12610]|uniref:protein phosphatase CheZ n=1 Tax=Kordiimonas sp. SCSIO 12610 TaxID=2829597 RepID=UPI00210A1FA4|nr:protein phosphatase CheZ [Kordiimonas sp. SCSIO 12610]UTW54858.1 protein phosphatase CheZ [Kordiimonas sp. SCSIO 12610]
MLNEELPRQIELLVDNLRKNGDEARSLTDVAMVTEVLIGTMQAFFRTVDTAIYKECRELGEYISNARKEIASLQPASSDDDDEKSDRLPRAGMELDAIVQATEDATNTIMEAAEEIMGADVSDIDAYQALTTDAVMRIFEACSFQDITGQRVSKVVQTLHHIEERVEELSQLLGVSEKDILESKKLEADKVTEDQALLAGPALDGEGIDQSDIDALLNDDLPGDVAPKAAPLETPAPSPEPTPEPKPTPPPAPEPPKAVNPKQLDNMFEEDFDPMAEIAAKEEEKKAQREAEAAQSVVTDNSEPEAEIDMPEGEEVSQDDIDALFG